MRVFSCALAGLASLSVAGSLASAAVIHFDDFSTDSLTLPNPTYNTSASRNRPSYAPSAGVPQLDGNPNVTAVSGRAQRAGTSGLTNAFAATLATSVGTFGDYPTYEVSTYFRANVAAQTGTRGQIAGVGLSNFDNGFWSDALRTPTAHSGFEVMVAAGTSVDTVDLRLRNINTGAITPSISGTSTNPLLNQVWYKLDFTVTRNSDGTFDLAAKLFQLDAGESGARPGWYNPTLILSHSATGLTNTNFDATTPLFAGFGVRRNQSGGNDMTGFGSADDFQVVGIPEPSSLALLGLAGLALMRRRQG